MTLSEGLSFLRYGARRPLKGRWSVETLTSGLHGSETQDVGKIMLFSPKKLCSATPTWRRFEAHLARCPLVIVWLIDGQATAATMPRIAMTTSSSIKVNPRFETAGDGCGIMRCRGNIPCNYTAKRAFSRMIRNSDSGQILLFPAMAMKSLRDGDRILWGMSDFQRKNALRVAWEASSVSSEL
jgi:hypothetical protein